MEEPSIKERKEIENPVPLVGNMKNKLSSLLKSNPLETKTKVTNAETSPILSLTLLRRKRQHKETSTPGTATNTKKNQIDDVPKNVIKPILNISKLKQNLNKQINNATAVNVNIKSEPDDDDDVPLKTLKRKLNDMNAAKNKTPPATQKTPLKLNILNLKSKLDNALKVAETLKENEKNIRKPRKYGFIVDINQIIADKKHNIFYCKYCFKYFQNVVALRYHVVQHAKLKMRQMKMAKRNDGTQKKLQTTQCDICQYWFVNVQLHKEQVHKHRNKKTENHKK